MPSLEEQNSSVDRLVLSFSIWSKLEDMTSEDVARWMLEKINDEDELSQEEAAQDIPDIFGENFIYENENGNPAISKDVLKVFRKLSGNDVIWDRGERIWRKRNDYDEPGRQQN